MKKSKIKQEFEILNSAISSLAARVKELEGSTKQINEPLSELPEKWCIRKHYNINEPVGEWFNKQSNNKLGIDLKNNYTGDFLNYPIEDDEPFISRTKKEGYTEISFSDFEKLVLKKGELVAGNWYKYNNWLLCYASLNSENFIIAYGFDNNRKWHEQDMFGCTPEDWIPATKEEVESALIEEAKNRGHKPHENLFYYDVLFNILYDRYGVGRQIIFNNGKWATIVEEPKQEIDWSVPGILYKCEDLGTIILSIESTQRTFGMSGVVLDPGKSIHPIGYTCHNFDTFWLKAFDNTITLSNEPI